MTPPRLLTLNAGSSSLKFGVYECAQNLVLLHSGQVYGIGGPSRIRAVANGQTPVDEAWPDCPGLEEALPQVFTWLAQHGWTDGVAAVGHRIVHGGRHFLGPTRLTSAAIARLTDLASLAPLHQPFNLRGIEIARRRLPGTLQVGVFDTAFHAQQPEIARLYALPRNLIDDGILAYGFHGLSYDYITGVLRTDEGPEAGGRCIVLHLGSGVSLCALEQGRSIATTMGFSALEGPPMSTRSGSLDSGIVLHLIQDRAMSVMEVTDLLYNRSGLLGLSGLSGDMMTLLASAEPRAQQALEVYVYRIAREIGSLTAALGGLDTLVFTAGVGENAPQIRERIAALCKWLGVRLDPQANLSGDRRISRADSAVKVLMIPTDEQFVIAQGTAGLM
ncbi:acetate/propionate family kinase [soil metagenome]